MRLFIALRTGLGGLLRPSATLTGDRQSCTGYERWVMWVIIVFEPGAGTFKRGG